MLGMVQEESLRDPNPEELEYLWGRRVKDARLRLAFARHYVKEVQRDFPQRLGRRPL